MFKKSKEKFLEPPSDPTNRYQLLTENTLNVFKVEFWNEHLKGLEKYDFLALILYI